MQSRNCPKCGKTMTFEGGNEPTFCSNCGERLNAHHDAVAVVPDSLLNGQSGIEEQILLKKMENEARQIGFVEGTKKSPHRLWNNSMDCCNNLAVCGK